MRRICLAIALLLFPLLGLCQMQCGFSVRENATLASPWCGGLNACQFGQMDLDGDGKKDLVVFDRQGNRVLCFLNKGGVGEIDYQYDATFASCFPKLTDWAVFADYDGDGREDIFTYSKGWAGIKVYRNVSDGKLAFELAVAPYLTSLQGGGAVNLMATDADYPAIVDLDGDGDLDILTFGVLGTFIEKHLNLSVEMYGSRDSLVYERTEYCWGRVAESEENNAMYLDTCLFGKSLIINKDGFRHRGATFAVRDLTGNGLPDLLLGDVDYPGLIFLRNGGDADHALMVSQETRFPSNQPVNLFSMPVPFFADINNDGADDLIVSPFDPNPMASVGKESVWLYLNLGTNKNPDYQLYSKSFLQEMMIDLGTGAYPAFTDVNGDGLDDLIVGTIGNIDSTYYIYGALQTHRSAQLYCYLNVGTTQNPVFQLADDDFVGLKSLKMMGLVPTFGDVNHDGKLEIIVGTAEGRLLLCALDGEMLDDDFQHFQKSWSAPCLYDVDNDGFMDLAVGNADGRLSFYRGTSHGFEWVTDFWGEVDVRDHASSYFGYSVPTLFRKNGELLLAVGSEQGKLFLYNGVSTASDVAFEDVTEQWNAYLEDFDNAFGLRSSCALADLDNDGNWEMCVGNFGGGLQLIGKQILVNQNVDEFFEANLQIYPNPVKDAFSVVLKKGEIVEITVIDGIGRKILSRKGEERIDVSSLKSGLYLLFVTTESGTLRTRFVKE